MRPLRLREVKSPAKGHKVNRQQRQDLKPGLCDSKAWLSNTGQGSEGPGKGNHGRRLRSSSAQHRGSGVGGSWALGKTCDSTVAGKSAALP